jgi:diguanylate cyclase (GGDEF)-like protein/hemerythrin-like metal-binding protein|tara:strand:- start:330 stop:1466 length:1137 start_codon:yes stop_codon:yes gene_type:complete
MNEIKMFPWSDFFEVGVDEIDTQHGVLVNIINEICSCILSTKEYEETMNSLFIKLIDYTKYHFESEEQYFKRNFLPEDLLETHAKYHTELVSEVLMLKGKYDTGSNKNTNLEEILTKLVVWLTNHILQEDMRMCMITSNVDSGMSVDEAKRRSDKEMHGPKGTVAKVMSSMMHVSSASVLELRREIEFRRRLEEQLTEEISVRKGAEEKLKHLAQHDALTGLPNRRLFEELGSVALSFAKRNKYEQAILFVDIDGFKDVNDTLGHKAGDALLIMIAKRLEECVRESDIVARLGGDEFTIHLGSDCSANDAKTTASKIVESISKPFDLGRDIANVSASVGISIYPNDAEDVETLVQNADAAMYVAKKLGKNAYKFFNEC